MVLGYMFWPHCSHLQAKMLPWTRMFWNLMCILEYEVLSCNNSELYLICVQCALRILFHIKFYMPNKWHDLARTLESVCEVGRGFNVCNMKWRRRMTQVCVHDLNLLVTHWPKLWCTQSSVECLLKLWIFIFNCQSTLKIKVFSGCCSALQVVPNVCKDCDAFTIPGTT